MAETKLSVEEIKEIMSRFAELKLGEFKLKDGDFEIKIEGKKTEVCVMPQKADQPVAATAIQESVQANAAEIDETAKGNVVKSPIVGTFYSSSAPDKPSFATVGKKVKKGDVLFIVESMKLMNEIQSDYTGEIVEILVNNGDAVEYGQPVMIIK